MKFFYRSLLVLVSIAVISAVWLLLLARTKHERTQRYRVLVDTADYSKEDQQRLFGEALPNLPVEFWRSRLNYNTAFNKTCAKFPSPLDLNYRNLYWQSLLTSDGVDYQLFGAYLDDRADNSLGATVRILGMVNRIHPVPLYCQIWFERKNKPVFVRAANYSFVWHREFGNYHDGIHQPFLIPCPIPSYNDKLAVAAVSLVEHVCDNATNSLKVFRNKPAKKGDFAVCVKGLDFLYDDISLVLTEWIEMMTILGAEKIFVYNLQVHPNVSKVLKYYQDVGRVEVIPLTLPAGEPNVPYLQHQYLYNRINFKRQAEVIPYNDCFYKHMYEYRYIAVLDVDEIIVPSAVDTWTELIHYMEQNLEKRYDSYNFRIEYFITEKHRLHKVFDDTPEYMHILNHVQRTSNIEKPGHYIKTFHNTDQVLSVHNHFPFQCLKGYCKNYAVPPQEALVFHYKRKSLEAYSEFLEDSVTDTTILKYKKQLIKQVTAVLKHLGFLIPA